MKSNSKLLTFSSIIITCIVLGIVAFKHGYGSGNGEEEAAPRAARSDPAVETLKLIEQPFGREQVYNGTLRAREHITIRTEVSGRVAAIHFEDGAEVEKGTLLLEIDDRELRSDRDARAEELELAKLNADRLEALFLTNAITQRERDEAVSRRNVLAAQVENISVRLEKTKIYAPFSGVLGFREVSLGALLQSDSPITDLRAVNPILVDFAVPERSRTHFRKGMPVTIRVSGFDEAFEGEVTVTDPSVDPMTRTITIRARVENPDRTLLPGSFGRVSVREVNENAILVPAVSVVRGLAEVSVYVVEDNTAKRRTVRVGHRGSEFVEVLEGLSAGDELIVRGTQSVRQGSGVNIVESAEQEPRDAE